MKTFTKGKCCQVNCYLKKYVLLPFDIVFFSFPAVVSLVKKYGVFVRLPAYKFRKSALIPTRNLADFFVEDPQEYLVNHETMYAKVVEKGGEDQKVAMSSKLKDVSSNNSDHAVRLMESLLADMKKIAKVQFILTYQTLQAHRNVLH